LRRSADQCDKALRQWNYQNLVCCSYSLRFRQQFQRHDAPSRDALLLWVSKWRQEGSAKGSKSQGRPSSVPAPDNVERVRDAMLRSPRRSAQQQAIALCLDEYSVRLILHKDLHYRPYKIQVAQELSKRDKVSQLQFCNEFLDLAKNNSDIVNILLMSDMSGMCINRIVANGLQTTHMNFTNVLCIVQK